MIDIRKHKPGLEKPAADPAATAVFSPLGRSPVEGFIAAKGLSKPIAGALMRYTRWGAGQMVTKHQFDAALAAILGKPVDKV